MKSKNACRKARDYARKLKIIPRRPSEEEKVRDDSEQVQRQLEVPEEEKKEEEQQ